jgi:hypothetical protein
MVIHIARRLGCRLAVGSNTIPWAIANVSRDSNALEVNISLSIVSLGKVVTYSSIPNIYFGYGFGFRLWRLLLGLQKGGLLLWGVVFGGMLR